MTTPATEVDRNYDVFLTLLPALLRSDPGKYALLHGGDMISLYESAPVALTAGIEKYGLGHFSVQEVTTECDNLGFYSYVGSAGQA